MGMLLDEELTYRIRGCVFEVSRELGGGYLEKVYERALLRELKLQGLEAQQQVPFPVRYKGEIVGEYYADLVVERSVVLELKAQDKLSGSHDAQLLHYLRASGKQIGMLVNFASARATIKRLVL
jgi:GxxExxY protein